MQVRPWVRETAAKVGNQAVSWWEGQGAAEVLAQTLHRRPVDVAKSTCSLRA